jgi:hypothetical protein
MAKGVTHFEQIPVKIVTKIAKAGAKGAPVKAAAQAQGRKI